MRRWLVGLALLLPALLGALDLDVELEDKHLDVSLVAGVALPGRIIASWYEDFDPDYTGWFTTQVSPMARLSATWWPSPRLAWVAPTVSVHYAALLLPEPYNVGFWDGRDHWLPDDGIHFLQVEGGVRMRFFPSGTWTVDPAVSLGYCRTFSSSIDARNSGMTVDLAADLRWWRRGWQPVATAGLMMQVYGGVKGIYWVRSWPVVYLALGAGL